MFRTTHANGVATCTFESLQALPLRAHVTTRHGGVSPAPWNTLNFSARRGDSRENVAQNRLRLGEALGIDAHALIFCEQVHGTGIAKVDGSDAGQVKKGCDGLITDSTGQPIGLVFADCVPVLVYDRRRHALGMVHAGWRGTVNRAASALVWAMQAAYDSDPGDLVGCIGPSIGPSSYEVGEEVWEMAQARLVRPERFFDRPHGAGEKPHLNLWAANASQLADEGIPGDQIEIAGIDTAQYTADFFSHRAEQGRCGLFAMVAWLQPT